ncbi:hypothetical protein Poli38472_012466 [Pythium oligandrum]|uniref:Tc3 transposase DNA binding domain-containing protein n=1 Tax=Pythium oligandrum TaxID=41045 RepID=A0A8K1FKP7_PYTOL|nr:hypothetical protein Poli38472_012466 [Pythium oligandrum]|eukprot:TMW67350.1 hypothetical protein Poli38472_012466 [Pythium oligandrum]
MPKGPALTAAERDEIRTLHAKNVSAREIAKKLERSKTVVLNYLRNPTQYGQTKRSGRKRALTPEQEEQIYTALRQQSDKMCVDPTSKMSAERIRREFNLPLSTRRIQQLLSDWRRQARKATDQQHAVDDVEDDNATEDTPTTATETESTVQDTEELLPSSIIV